MQHVSTVPDRDFEVMQTIPNPLRPSGRKLTVLVSKMGGGRTDRAYTGRWLYRVRWAGGGQTVVAEGDDLETGSPKTHMQVIRLVEDFLPDLMTRED